MSTFACFDVCGTLYRGITTWDFARYVTRRRSGPLSGALEAGLAIGRILARMGAADASHRVATWACVTALRGLSAADLQRQAEGFWAERWPARANPSVVALLERFRAEGREIVLVSAAIDPPIEALGRLLEARVVCTRLRLDHAGHVAGLQADLLGNKRGALIACIGEQALRSAVLVSDNRTDVPLLNEVARGIRVVSDGLRPLTSEPGRQLETIHV